MWNIILVYQITHGKVPDMKKSVVISSVEIGRKKNLNGAGIWFLKTDDSERKFLLGKVELRFLFDVNLVKLIWLHMGIGRVV